MNEDKSPSLVWSVAILALTYLIFAVWQIQLVVGGINTNTEVSQKLTLEVDKTKVAAANMDRFYRDLLELSKTDPDAKAITEKNQIVAIQNP